MTHAFVRMPNARVSEKSSPRFLGSARVSRVGFVVSPKQSFSDGFTPTKSPRKRDAFASTRDACATQTHQ
jgi:hypothetical protein